MDSKKSSIKRHNRFRLLMQILATMAMNGYLIGFLRGEVANLPTKAFCVPVLNCYSCPGALGSCPIGALQTLAGGVRHTVSLYVLGGLMLVGVVLGRLTCGFLCPFGMLQDLLHKIPHPKIQIPKKLDRVLRFVKYVVLIFMVILIPLWAGVQIGIAPPFFCEYVCPAGTFEAGLPLVFVNEELRSLVGTLFDWKCLVLFLVLVGSVVVSRFFCKYLCPLGAFYALFNKCSICSMSYDKSACISCGSCIRHCPMDIDIRKKPTSGECIRCGSCKAACPSHAIDMRFILASSRDDNSKSKKAHH